MFKRVVLKLSGEYLAGEIEKNVPGEKSMSHIKHVDYAVSDKIVSDIVKAVEDKVQVAVVIGGGNFWRGRDVAEGFNRAKADNMGMLASVMNGIFLSERFLKKGVAAHVMTPFAVGGMTQIYNQDAAVRYLENGNIVIFAGGTGQPYFSTDTITIIRAADLQADCALFAKDVEGVCDKDPRKAASGSYKVYRETSASQMISEKLTVIDIAAMIIARDTKINSALFDIRAENAIEIACSGDQRILSIGTKISCL